MKRPTTRRAARRRHSAEQIARILSEYQAGGVTQRELARKHGICVATLQNWLRRVSETSSPPPQPWIEVIPDHSRSAGGGYRVELPDGVAIVLPTQWRPEDLRALVHALVPR